MNNEAVNKIFESKKEYHKARRHDTPEQKYLVLIELQKIALELRKSKGKPIKAHETVWPIQF